MQYIEAPDKEKSRFKSVFLAGGITNCPDWQSYVAEKLKGLPIAVFNPRRKSYPQDKKYIFEQIEWEHQRLREADILAFWFSEGSLNPIVLFELGSALERDKPIIVGVHPDYPRKTDVEIQTKLERPNINIFSDLDSFAAEIIKFFDRIKK